MAEVWAALDHRLRRQVAIKRMRPEVAAVPGVRERFEAEARAAAGLSHPHVVAIFDVGEDGEVPYLVMERLPGETLADRIGRDGPADVRWLLAMIDDVLSALAAAHAAGIVHRDVKPANILLAADGSAKVADFGIAKSVTDDAGSDLTTTGQLLGTPAYLAPERLAGQPATPASDLYSVGVVMYEALAGIKPFTGEHPVAVALAVQGGRPVPLDTARPGLSPALVAIVERAMDPDPGRRFGSAAEMAAALGAGGGAAVRAGVDASPTVVMAPLPPHELPPEELADATLRDAAVGGGLGAWLWQRRREAVAAVAGLVLAGSLLAVRAAGGSGSGPTHPSAVTTVAPSTVPPTTAVPVTNPRHHGNGKGNGDGGGGGGDGG